MSKTLFFQALSVGVLYYLGALVGVYITSLDGQIPLLWPPNAILLSVLLLSPPRQWVYFIAAVFCAEIVADIPVFSFKAASLFALVNILECLLITFILRKTIKLESLMSWDDPQKVILFIVSVLFVATPLAALGGAAVNLYVENVDKSFFDLWRLWWLGDASGLMLLTPILLNFFHVIQHKQVSLSMLNKNRYFIGVAIFSLSIWGGIFLFSPSDSQLFALMPILIILPILWDLLKLSGSEKIMVSALLALFMVLLTANHVGPFYQEDLQTTALLTQEFILVFLSIIFLVSAYHSQAMQKALNLKLYQSAIESVREGIVITEADNDQKVVFCNKAFEVMTGYPADEILGQNCRFLNRNHQDQKNLSLIKNAIEKREAIQVVVLNSTKQDQDFWNNLSITPITSEKGKVTHFSGVQLDITEKVNASQKLEDIVLERTKELTDSRERLELASSVSGLGIWEWDLTSDQLVWDAQMHTIYETPDDVKDSGLFYEFWSQSVHPDEVEQAAASLAEAVETQQKWDYEFRILLPDGAVKNIKAFAAVKVGTDGQPIKMIGGNIDITQQRELERKLKSAVEEAKNANRAKSEFLANMSHEIRTPMNGVLGMSELMKGTPLNSRQKDYVGMIESSAKSLLLLLNDILDLSKIEAGQLMLDPMPACLDESIGDIMKGFAVTAHTKGLELHYYIHPNTPRCVTVDRLRLGQILFNLVGNAVKFTNQGEVLVDVSSDEAHLVAVGDSFKLKILVKDTGVGIPKEKQTDIFKPFHQADNSVTRKFGGTGLGLPIVVHLVKLMGGDVSLTSEQGSGTQLEILIPVTRCADSDLDVKPQILTPAIDFTNLRILAVDDNAINQRWLNDMVHSWGSRIDLASSVDEALKVLERSEKEKDPINILLTDKNMPHMSGFDLIEMIPKKGLKKPSIIIMLSSSEVETDIKTATSLGVEQFILKPVKQSEVFNAIQNAMGYKAPKEWEGASNKSIKAIAALDILVAEDNIVNQRVINDILESRGHKITLVENGALAINRVKENFYDVILMDVQMPEMDGFEATKRIRSIQKNLSTRSLIIGVTAHALKGDKEIGLQSGMDGYVTKPVFAEHLIKVVEQSIFDQEIDEVHDTKLNEIEVFFDVDKALKVTGNDRDLLQKMAHMTLGLLPESLENVDKSLVSRSETEMKVFLHKLTGMIANLCSHELVMKLKLLEESLHETISEANEQHWLNLRAKIKQFEDELTVFLKES